MSDVETIESQTDDKVFLYEIYSRASADEALSESIKARFKNLALNGTQSTIHLFERGRVFRDDLEIELFYLVRKIALTMTDEKERQVVLSADNTSNASWLLDLRGSAFAGRPYLFSQSSLTLNEGQKKETYISRGYGISLTFDYNPAPQRLPAKADRNSTLVTISRTSGPILRRGLGS